MRCDLVEGGRWDPAGRKLALSESPTVTVVVIPSIPLFFLPTHAPTSLDCHRKALPHPRSTETTLISTQYGASHSMSLSLLPCCMRSDRQGHPGGDEGSGQAWAGGAMVEAH